MNEAQATQTVYINDAAAAVGVTRRTLYNWMAEGLLPFTVVHGSRRVHLADVVDVSRMRPLERWARMGLT